MSRCVFVGNIPYDATEAQLVQICEEIGPVISFRLVTDRETGKPKGYGFCEFKDEETALSARRNLSGYELGGRQLRVDFAENEKAGSGPSSERGKDQVRGGPASNQGPAGEQTIGYSAAASAAGVMAGALGAQKGQNGGNAAPGQDGITQHLANMSKHQLYDVMCQMKALVLQDQQQARRLLIANPQLTKALFQAQIMLGMVHLPQGGQKPPLPPSSGPVGSQGFSVPPAASAYPQQPTMLPQPPPLQRAPPPPSMGHIPSSQLPPQNMGFQAPPPPPFPHQPQFGMNVPFQSQAQPPLPPQPPPFQQQHPGMGLAGQGLGPPMGMDRGYQQPPQQQKQPPYGMDGGPMPVYGQVQMPGPPQQLPLEIEHRNLLQQVMNLTPEQMSMLPPEQRQQVLQLQQAIQLQQMR